MENIEEKLKEVMAVYQEKMKNLQQTAQLLEKLRTECIHLEGKIEVLKELQK